MIITRIEIWQTRNSDKEYYQKEALRRLKILLQKVIILVICMEILRWKQKNSMKRDQYLIFNVQGQSRIYW